MIVFAIIIQAFSLCLYFLAGIVMIPMGVYGILQFYEAYSTFAIFYVLALIITAVFLWHTVVITETHIAITCLVHVICMVSIISLCGLSTCLPELPGDLCSSLAWLPISLGFKGILEVDGSVNPVRIMRQQYSTPVPVDPVVEYCWNFDRIFRDGKVIFHNKKGDFTAIERRQMDASVPLSLKLKYLGDRIELRDLSDTCWCLKYQQISNLESDSTYTIQYEEIAGSASVVSRVLTSAAVAVQYTLDIEINGYTLRFLAKKKNNTRMCPARSDRRTYGHILVFYCIFKSSVPVLRGMAVK